ncbi:uncharacterized protein LOC120350854 [Nilaparvata lugens]|uniref:uncharacterized protein LOC120350854 n=1 Tax=Nilaparvata lugens TaxID=108931 RepID=UPI00193D48AA|nr:uncharacterized protein LOC120350854 [Nilaparvata lugens]
MSLLGMSEVKKKGNGTQVMDGNYVLRYSGVAMNARAKGGVGFIVTEEMDRKVTSWKAVSSRLITLCFDLEVSITLIQAYAPTEDAHLVEKEEFYDELQRQIDINETAGRRVIIMGDLNGRVGQDNQTNKGILGPYGGEDEVNTNGERILDLCALNNMIVANSYYNHKRIHKITFKSAQGSSLIDYFLVPKELKSSINDVKVIRGAELSTDHYLLVADTAFAKNRNGKRSSYQRVKWELLNDEAIARQYQEKIEMKLQAPLNGEDEVESRWSRLKAAIVDSSREVCRLKSIKEGVKSTKWWSQEIKVLVAEKKHAWKKWKQTRDPNDRAEYELKRNWCKRQVAGAKKQSWKEFGERIEHDFSHDNKKFWKLIRHLRGKYSKKVRSVKDSQNKLRVNIREVLEVWREFYERKFKDDRHTLRDWHEEEQEDEQENIGFEEVERAVSRMKNGRQQEKTQ